MVAITPTPTERAARYHEMFSFVHPYLCDPEGEIDGRYGLPRNPAGQYLRIGVIMANADLRRSAKVPLDPTPEEGRRFKSGRTDGFFIVDKGGVVRFARTGYRMGTLPSNAQLFEQLAAIEAATRQTHP